MDIRRSPATRRNDRVRSAPGRKSAGNREWLRARAEPGAVVFLGGATLVDFRVRVAQSALRQDLLPSFWSAVGIADADSSLLTAPLATGDDPAIIPSTNGVQRFRFDAFDDPARFPNVAVIGFADPAAAIVGNVRRLMGQRSAIDLPSMILPWLAFVWGAGARRNPLDEHVGLPGAALAETAFGMSGIELTPGLASGSRCPEAIRQSAVWSHDYYRETADVTGALAAGDEREARRPPEERPRAIVPAGEYWVRQDAAAVTSEVSPKARPATRRPRRTSKNRTD
jgi:hypothetical protein